MGKGCLFGRHRCCEAGLRGCASLDFLLDLASAAQISLADARRGLNGIRVVVVRSLREKSLSRIPRLVSLRLQTLPAREGFTKTIKGKACVWKARQHGINKIAAVNAMRMFVSLKCFCFILVVHHTGTAH